MFSIKNTLKGEFMEEGGRMGNTQGGGTTTPLPDLSHRGQKGSFSCSYSSGILPWSDSCLGWWPAGRHSWTLEPLEQQHHRTAEVGKALLIPDSRSSGITVKWNIWGWKGLTNPRLWSLWNHSKMEYLGLEGPCRSQTPNPLEP